MSIIETILLKYPNIEGVQYWNAQYDGTLWSDPYEGLIWNNTEIPKPSKEELNQWENEVSLIYLQKTIEKELRELIESKPGERGYDSIATISSYITSSNIQWKAEADAFIAWRDSVFEYAYNIQSQVQLGQISVPTIEEFISNVPILEWP